MKKPTIFAASILACAAPVSAQDVQVSARIDSVQTLQGMLRQIDIEVVQPEGLELDWMIPTPSAKDQIVELYPSIEIRHDYGSDTSRIGSDRLQITRSLLVQPWDSGEFLIPGIELVNLPDTFRSGPIALKVLPADTDTLTSIHAEYMPVLTQKAHTWDWVPDWLYNNWWAFLIALILIGGAITALILNRRKGSHKKTDPKVRIIPPYEKAIAQLDNLQQQKLCEKGMEKQFYTSLTEILREYLEGRFGINAMEMTTPQIKRAVYATVPEKTASTLMNDVLEMADYVKFAKMRPLPEDNMRSFNQARTFVENTRPQPAENTANRKEASK